MFRCNHPQVTLGKTIMSSGAFHIWERCDICGENARGEGQFIGKKSIDSGVIENLPVFADYTLQSEPCEVCNQIGTEIHHWAPKELFPEDYEEWPKSYLCKNHHWEWHKKVTIPFRTLRNRNDKRGDK